MADAETRLAREKEERAEVEKEWYEKWGAASQETIKAVADLEECEKKRRLLQVANQKLQIDIKSLEDRLREADKSFKAKDASYKSADSANTDYRARDKSLRAELNGVVVELREAKRSVYAERKKTDDLTAVKTGLQEMLDAQEAEVRQWQASSELGAAAQDQLDALKREFESIFHEHGDNLEIADCMKLVREQHAGMMSRHDSQTSIDGAGSIHASGLQMPRHRPRPKARQVSTMSLGDELDAMGSESEDDRYPSDDDRAGKHADTEQDLTLVPRPGFTFPFDQTTAVNLSLQQPPFDYSKIIETALSPTATDARPYSQTTSITMTASPLSCGPIRETIDIAPRHPAEGSSSSSGNKGKGQAPASPLPHPPTAGPAPPTPPDIDLQAQLLSCGATLGAHTHTGAYPNPVRAHANTAMTTPVALLRPPPLIQVPQMGYEQYKLPLYQLYRRSSWVLRGWVLLFLVVYAWLLRSAVNERRLWVGANDQTYQTLVSLTPGVAYQGTTGTGWFAYGSMGLEERWGFVRGLPG